MCNRQELCQDLKCLVIGRPRVKNVKQHDAIHSRLIIYATDNLSIMH